MTSASLYNYMPEIPILKHFDIYKNILLHKKLSILEQRTLCVLDSVKIEDGGGDILKKVKEVPSIICTFHTGSYRVINLLLIKNAIPFTLVMGNAIGEQEGESFTTIFKKLSGNDKRANLRIINAESPGAVLQMLRELKQGRTLVLYIDGNSGAGAGTAENENSLVVRFMQQGLFVRKGIAFLAQLAKVPILTVVSYRKSWNDIRVKFYEPIMPESLLARKEFEFSATQQIYDQVSPVIARYPEQWEGWLYIHKYIKKINLTPHLLGKDRRIMRREKVQFNSKLFSIFKLHDVPFLLNRNTYSFYEIDSRLYDQLFWSEKCPINRRHLSSNLFSQLYDEGVLVSA